MSGMARTSFGNTGVAVRELTGSRTAPPCLILWQSLAQLPPPPGVSDFSGASSQLAAALCGGPATHPHLSVSRQFLQGPAVLRGTASDGIGGGPSCPTPPKIE